MLKALLSYTPSLQTLHFINEVLETIRRKDTYSPRVTQLVRERVLRCWQVTWCYVQVSVNWTRLHFFWLFPFLRVGLLILSKINGTIFWEKTLLNVREMPAMMWASMRHACKYVLFWTEMTKIYKIFAKCLHVFLND
jgi:hypothetical protein